MRTKEEILEHFKIFSMDQAGGIGSWITAATHDDVFNRLGSIDQNALSYVQLNQLLVLSHEAPVSDGFFRYYWLSTPGEHPYDIRTIVDFNAGWLNGTAIVSLDHLKWGLYRLYVDALLFFGNIRAAFRYLRNLSSDDLADYFKSRRFDAEAIKSRGPAMPLKQIAKDNRYLISEMACKSYGDTPESPGDLKNVLIGAFKVAKEAGHSSPTIRQLLEGGFVPTAFATRQQEFIFSADDVLDIKVSSEDDLTSKFERVASDFFNARKAALDNTRYYLSMVNDLDVYVATSMRTRQDFRNVANTCERIFNDGRLQALNLRYFDPTLSAAGGHEDKGLIECLMVKCAKVLVYSAGEKESYGKDAEAAMALSLGKPVIFYCDQEQRSRFYRDVHPLSRLIEFQTGVAVGAMVTDRIEDVSELLYRILENRMEYYLEQTKPNFIRLKEKVMQSVVRLQTSDRLLTETFWNHYHKHRNSESI